MSHARIVVNDEVLCDGDYNQWIVRPPEFIVEMAEMVQPNSSEEPEAHMLAVMAIAGVSIKKQDGITIEVSKGPDGGTLTWKIN